MEQILGVPLQLKKMIDDLVEESSHASEQYPVTERDWKIVVQMYELWRVFFPNHYDQFIKSAEMYRREHLFNKGVVKEGNSMLQHKLEIPEMLYNMIKKVFPRFRFTNEQTVKKFIALLPEFGSYS